MHVYNVEEKRLYRYLYIDICIYIYIHTQVYITGHLMVSRIKDKMPSPKRVRTLDSAKQVLFNISSSL